MNEPLRRTVRLLCPIGHAFDVFTARINLWWPPGHRRLDKSDLRLEPVVDGRFFERDAAGQEFVLGRVLQCDPPNGISFTWNPGKITGPTQVNVRFDADGDTTIVNVEHHEADSALGEHWQTRAALFGRGWDHVLAALVAHCDATPPESIHQPKEIP